MAKEKIVMAWSGGKDSALALHELLRSGRVEVVSLLTTVTETYDRISMHGVRNALLDEQARSIGIPCRKIGIAPGCSNAEYETKMADALAGFKERGVSAVAFGDIFLEDLKRWRESNLAKMDLKGIFPLWKRDTKELAHTFIRLGFKAILSCVDPRALPPEFVGRDFDEKFLADLPKNVDPCGENGEFHSFVHAGPVFRVGIPVSRGEKVLRDSFWFCDLLPGRPMSSVVRSGEKL